MIESTSQGLQKAGGAERAARSVAEKLFIAGAVTGGSWNAAIAEKVLVAALEKCANEARLEALEQAAALADRADSSGMVFAGKTVPVAYAIRALKEATP